MATWYVDNEHGGTNAGTQANPFKTLAALWVAMAQDDIAYIKATDTPYRESLYSSDCFGSTFYLDWTGTGTDRGTARAKFYASDVVSTWTQYSGNIYSAAFSDASGLWAAHIYGGDEHNYGAWYVAPGGAITILSKGANADSLTAGQFHWNGSDTLYVNVGEDPDAGTIEVMQRIAPFEIFTEQQIYRGDFRFGLRGQKNDTCYGWIIDGCEVSYNISHGLWNVAGQADIISKTDRCHIHHNMGRGIFISGKFANNLYQVSYNVVHDNGLSGIYSDGPSNAEAEFQKIANNTVYGNNTLHDANEGGFYFTNTQSYDCYLHITNNISTQNYGYEYFAVNDTDIHLLTESNNAYDSANGDTVNEYWPTPDIDGSPAFVNAANGDFTPGTVSCLRNTGANATWSGIADIVSANGITITDGAGNITAPEGIVDVGAYEKYYVPGGVLVARA